MSQNFHSSARFVFSGISLFLLFVVAGIFPVKAQKVLTGNWKATFNSEKKDKIQLSFSRQTERGSRNQHSSNFSLSDLQGLSQNQISANEANVNFRLAREAGTIECEGKFTNGKGEGTFRFTGNPQFVSAMKSRGFDFEKNSENIRYNDDNDNDTLENRLFAATIINVTTALADDLLSANFGKLDTGDLFKAAIFKVDSTFMKEMKASGFPNLDFDDLVKARIFKIDGEYLRQLNASGFGKEPFESVVKMKIFKITPEYITSFRNAGFNNLTMNELQKLSIFKVTPEFIKELRSEGLNNLSIEQITKMKIFKIDGAVIRQAKADNVDLDAESLVRYKIGGWKRKAVVWN